MKKIFKLIYFYLKYNSIIKTPHISNSTILAKGVTIEKGSIVSHSQIGQYTYINRNNSIFNTTIGAFTSIGPHCNIGENEHLLHYITTSESLYNPKIIDHLYSLNNKVTVIDSDVWIGANVFIKKGVNIAQGAVIGANSVVTKDIPPYAIAVGNPAKVIKYRFDPLTIQKLMGIKWEKLDYTQIVFILNSHTSINSDSQDIKKFLDAIKQ